VRRSAGLLADPKVTVVVVEHRDRLGRMNTELVESALSAHGRRLVVLDDGEVADDLVRDMVEVLTSFCARLYGRRSARDRALKRSAAPNETSARRRLSVLESRMRSHE
jgi:putative resolvase